jgi:hypothetical protein
MSDIIQTEGGRRIIPIVEQRNVLTVRASSWGSLFDCAHKWEGEHLLGMRKATGLRGQLGTALHASTATFDKGRLPGAERVTVDEAAGIFVDTLAHPEREVDYSQDELTSREAERIGLSLHTRYCFDVSPRFTFKSVEQRLEPVDIDCGSGTYIRLTGSMDRARVAEATGGIVIPDLKSGARVVSDGQAVTKGRAPQLGTYQILYEQTEGLVTLGGQIIALHTSSKPAVAVSPVFDAKRVMLGTEKAPGLIEHAAAMFRTGLFPPNPQSTLCSRKYCARWDHCNFHE